MAAATAHARDALTRVVAGERALAPEELATLPALAQLIETPQTPEFHGEGSVAHHTSLVLAALSAPAQVLSTPPSMAQLVLGLAALLHDAGKPARTREIVRTGERGPSRVWAAPGHDHEGAFMVSELFVSHPALTTLPLGVLAAVHASVRNHMWAWASTSVSPGSMLRSSHLLEPALLTALWRADALGRVCSDPDALMERIEFAELLLEEAHAHHSDSWGVLSELPELTQAAPSTRRALLRSLVRGGLDQPGAAGAELARRERAPVKGSLTWTMGLPGLGKSTWAREIWAPTTGGVVLSAEGTRRRDRSAARIRAMGQLPLLLAAGRDVCLDATHLTRESRDLLLAAAGQYNAPVRAVYFRGDLALSISRQSSRPSADSVASAVLTRMSRSLRWPTPDEYDDLWVMEPSARAWRYDPSTRWLDAAAALRLAPASL